ncbi:MAG: hypothetical protein ABIK78_01115 [candidate division WOR-3 bacterium]
MKINFRIISLLVFVFLFLLTFLFTKKSKKPFFHLEEKNLIVDSINKIIIFPGEVNKNKGEVQFLINLKGYEWLNEKASILSNIPLTALQNALAFLDWVLWESLYVYKKLTRKISVLIIVNEKEVPVESLIFPKENPVNFLNLIFLGDPYWDNLILKESYADCKKCPFLEEEIKFINKSFSQKYLLNTKFFPSDKKIKIKLILPDGDK